MSNERQGFEGWVGIECIIEPRETATFERFIDGIFSIQLSFILMILMFVD
jgi:hypothetical protein